MRGKDTQAKDNVIRTFDRAYRGSCHCKLSYDRGGLRWQLVLSVRGWLDEAEMLLSFLYTWTNESAQVRRIVSRLKRYGGEASRQN